jgi:hypothetical protein
LGIEKVRWVGEIREIEKIREIAEMYVSWRLSMSPLTALSSLSPPTPNT